MTEPRVLTTPTIKQMSPLLFAELSSAAERKQRNSNNPIALSSDRVQFQQYRPIKTGNRRKRALAEYTQPLTKTYFQETKENIYPAYFPTAIKNVDLLSNKLKETSLLYSLELANANPNKFSINSSKLAFVCKKDSLAERIPRRILQRPQRITPFEIANHTSSLSSFNASLSSSIIIDEDDMKKDKLCSWFQLASKLNKLGPQLSDFTKIKYLGKGKFGQVHLVRHNKTGLICAMKVISKAVIKEEKVEHQITREIKIHNTLRHLNIIDFYGFFDDTDNVYILIEYATGGQLYSQLKACHRMEQQRIVPIIRNVCEGVQMIHNMGFIHRDLKPENIILQFGIVKICDLGWAANCSLGEMRKSYCGTPLYLSPEMVKKQEYNTQTDIWAIGILTYELLVGRIPFKIWTESDLHEILTQEVVFPPYIDASNHCKNFILRCLCKDPKQRIHLEHMRKHTFLEEDLLNSYFNSELFEQIQLLR